MLVQDDLPHCGLLQHCRTFVSSYDYQFAMQRKFLFSVSQQWHPKYVRPLSQTHNAPLSLTLNGYSSHQLKAAKDTLEKGNSVPSILTYEDSLLLLTESARKFDAQLLCRAAIFSDSDTHFPTSASLAVVNSIKKSGTKEVRILLGLLLLRCLILSFCIRSLVCPVCIQDLKNFRSLLCNDIYCSKFEFDPVRQHY